MQNLQQYKPPELNDRAAIEVNLEHLRALTQHPGWRIFQAMCIAQQKSLIADITNFTKPDELMRTAGALAQTIILASWVDNQISSFQQNLINLKERENRHGR